MIDSAAAVCLGCKIRSDKIDWIAKNDANDANDREGSIMGRSVTVFHDACAYSAKGASHNESAARPVPKKLPDWNR